MPNFISEDQIEQGLVQKLQHLVDLLDKGEIPHHKVGTDRRVTFKDLLAYEKKRDTTRRAALDRLTDQVIEADKYFPDSAD
jgi:excisionase family DNA binding protein